MEAGEDPKDASLLNKRMWHRIFSSIKIVYNFSFCKLSNL